MLIWSQTSQWAFISAAAPGSELSEPAGRGCQDAVSEQDWGTLPFPLTIPHLTLLPLVLVLLVYMQMTSRARKKKGGHMELCE